MTTIRALARRLQRQRRHHALTARQAFYARGDAAWQRYKCDGIACPIDGVFDAIDARIDAARARFKPPRIELGVKPADLDDGSSHVTPADGNVFADLGFLADEAQALLQAADAARRP